MSILMIDDDIELCELMQRFLSGENIPVDLAHDGVRGLEMALSGRYELAIVDIMMPGKNGMDVLRDIRAQSTIPVIMLTARGEETDRIIGLELGADDYLPKPCNPRELAARIRAVLRRSDHGSSPAQPESLSIGSIEWHPKSHQIFDSGRLLSLTATEYALLACLLEHAGEVVDKQQASKAALGRSMGRFDRSLDVHIANLRKKLAPAENSEFRIRTVRGVGWLFVEQN